MTRLLPHPWLALFVFAVWLALAEQVTPGQVVLGAVAAVGGAWTLVALDIERPRLRRPLAALRLARNVTFDILRSNIAVLRIILTRPRGVHSNFVIIPLDLRSRAGLVLLAGIITATPGTIWVSHDRNSGRLLLHILDLVDEQTWIRAIKTRYERLLMEIFQ